MLQTSSTDSNVKNCEVKHFYSISTTRNEEDENYDYSIEGEKKVGTRQWSELRWGKLLIKRVPEILRKASCVKSNNFLILWVGARHRFRSQLEKTSRSHSLWWMELIARHGELGENFLQSRDQISIFALSFEIDFAPLCSLTWNQSMIVPKDIRA